jgi:hypothetical protein
MIELGNQQIVWLKPTALTANNWNPNSVGVENMEKLKASLSNTGFFKPVLYRTLEDGTKEIIGGEHRIIAAEELGIEVPTINLGEISDAMAKKLTLIDNDSYGENDTAQMAKVLRDLEASGVSITEEMTYSEDELSELLNMTVDVNFDDLDDLDDIEFGEDPETREKVSSDDEETVFKTVKVKVDISDAEDFEDMVQASLETYGIEDSDPAVARGLLIKRLLENDNDD